MLFLLLACLMFQDSQWKPIPENPTEVALWQDGLQIGVYEIASGKYFAMDSNGHKKPAEPPGPIPQEYAKKTLESTGNYGLDWSKINGSGETFTLSGEPITGSSARSLLVGQGNGPLQDDSQSLRLTRIYRNKETIQSFAEAIPEDIHQEIRAWAEEKKPLIFSQYPASHWIVEKNGYQVNPAGDTYILQNPDGSILYEGDDTSALVDLLRRTRKPGPLDIHWSSSWFSFNPLTWMFGIGFSRFVLSGELICIVVVAAFIAFAIWRHK